MNVRSADGVKWANILETLFRQELHRILFLSATPREKQDALGRIIDKKYRGRYKVNPSPVTCLLKGGK